MQNTKIEWADMVWNPITGCTPISDGCKHCYARRMANRLRGRFGYPEDDPFRVTFHEDKIFEPLKHKKPKRIFVCSMADPFHPAVDTEWIDAILDIIGSCPQHKFMMLTKRPENMEEKIYGSTKDNPCRELGAGDYMPNLWLGVTIEKLQSNYTRRFEHLIKIPASVHFVSYEPLLESDENESPEDIKPFDDIEWVIVGGETGPNARPFPITQAFQLIDNYHEVAKTPIFFKQIGDNWKDPIPHWFVDAMNLKEFPEGEKNGIN